MKRLLLIATFVAAALVAGGASAQDPADFPATGSLSDAARGAEQTRPFWSGSGPRRWFMSSTFGLGVVNFQPRIQLGYGKPHYQWYGVEGGSTLSLNSSRMYGGLRAKALGVDFRIGARFESQFSQFYLPEQFKYDRADIEQERELGAKYLAGEAELNGAIPFPGGALIAVVTGWAITGVPQGYNIWEQTLRTVVKPPWVWRARLGYLAHLGWSGSMKLGAAAEVIHVPARSLIVVRAGPLVSVGLTHHLEVNGGVMIVAASRDDIGLPAADIAQLGLVYKWALGDRWAEFP